jgi:hypothetical protein
MFRKHNNTTFQKKLLFFQNSLKGKNIAQVNISTSMAILQNFKNEIITYY